MSARMVGYQVREYECGHIEKHRENGPNFSTCYQCGDVGIERTYLTCGMPTCKNRATRVQRFAFGTAMHYCDECTPMVRGEEVMSEFQL
jgi:hypothetical protein